MIGIGAGLAVMAAVTTLAASSCGANDAPVRTRDQSGAAKFNMPDKFDTVAAKCIGGGVEVVETQNHGDSDPSSIAVVSNPKACPDGYRGAPR
jgi:hypothetical protein